MRFMCESRARDKIVFFLSYMASTWLQHGFDMALSDTRDSRQTVKGLDRKTSSHKKRYILISLVKNNNKNYTQKAN